MNSLPDSGFGWIPGGRILADRINQRANNFKAANPFGGFFILRPFSPPNRYAFSTHRSRCVAIAEVPLDFNLRGWDFSQPAEKAKQPLDQTSHELEQAAE
jgi:hypothetical protein